MMQCSIFVLRAALLLLSLIFASMPAIAGAKDYTLAWDPNPDPSIAGYKLFYRADGPIKSTGLYDAVIDVGKVTQYTVAGLDGGTIYYFSVKAYDTADLESPFSKEAVTMDGVPWDVNADGGVDAVDLVEIMQAFGATAGKTGWIPEADLDGSGLIDVDDLHLALLRYGARASSEGAVFHVISAGAGAGGVIFPESLVAVPDGGSRTFLISPEKGYVLDEVLLDDRPVGLTDDATYRFDNVRGDHSIEVRFAPTPELADELLLRMDFNGDLQDASGWEHHGSSSSANMPVFIVDRYGIEGKACQFDGFDDFVRVERSADFSLPEYTLTGWVYGMRDFNDTNPQYIAATNRQDTEDAVGMFAFADSLCAPGTGVPRAEDVLSDREHQWLHLAVVRDIWDVEFYLDGRYVGEMPAGSDPAGGLAALIVGARSNGDSVPGYGFFKGILDDVRLYNRPLNAAEIQIAMAVYGDVNRDGFVDEDDLLLLGQSYGAAQGAANWNLSADLDGSGLIDAGDLALAVWGLHSPLGILGNNALIGSSGDDLLTGFSGDDFLDGGDGTDTAAYPGAAWDYFVFQDYTGRYVVIDLQLADGDDGRDVLTGIEYLQFRDQTVAIAHAAATTLEILGDDMNYGDAMIGLPNGDTVSAAQAQLFRLYYGAMRRLPDDAGYAWWLNQIDQGDHDLRSVAACFISSPEFLGYVNAPDADSIPDGVFLTYMYQGVFGREPDRDGYIWWLNQLAGGYCTQLDVFIGMTQSNEYVELTLSNLVDYLYGIRSPIFK